MPLVSWLLYRGESGWWTAFVLFVFIASTDFIDGYLARKHGPTVLGGLLDPIADKVVIAMTYIPIMHLGLIPPWAVTLLFVREYMVTAMRSAFEQRGLAMKTSYIAKVKTWVQMQGIGVIMLVLLINNTAGLSILFGSAAGLALVAGLVFRVLKGRHWVGSYVMTGFVLALFLLWELTSPATTIDVLIYTVVVVTWLSGLDYLINGLPTLYKAGGFHRSDVVRVLASIALPILAVLVAMKTSAHIGPIVAIFAIELSVGGLDNLLSHHRVAAGAVAWSARTFGASALLGAALIVDASMVNWATGAAITISTLGVAREFWRGSDYYLESRLRNKSA